MRKNQNTPSPWLTLVLVLGKNHVNQLTLRSLGLELSLAPFGMAWHHQTDNRLLVVFQVILRSLGFDLSSARLNPVQLGLAPSLLIDDLKTDRSVVIQLILRSLVLNGQIVDISWVLFQFGILPNAKVLMLLKFLEHQNYEKNLQ